jgi:hypothetical protein
MNNKIKELLDEIEMKERKHGKTIYKKANDNEIEYFNNWILKYYKITFPNILIL